MEIAKKDQIVSDGGSSGTNKNLSKFEKPKNSTILSNIGANTKDTGFLTSETSTHFT